MTESRDFRELLVADLALVRGVAPARDVAAALQRVWDQRGQRGLTFASELACIAGLPAGALEAIEAEADRWVSGAGGDARAALSRRGVDRSIHVALSRVAPSASRALAEAGAGARAPLRTVDADRYIDFLVAGEGGMGVVYMALDTELNRFVAFKMVRPDAGHGRQAAPEDPMRASPPPRDTPATDAFEELKARFLQEAWVTGGLEHPGIVPVYELGQTANGIPYYTMRFVRGQRSLAQAIEEVRRAPIEERLRLLEPFLKVCDTLAYAHAKHVIHRDLKPDNVALGEFGEVVLLDWGLAKLEGREDKASSRWQERIHEYRSATDLRTLASGVGTPGYMSPEAALGELETMDERSDVYSLGVILFEILTGRLPIEGRTYAEYVDRLSRTQAPPAIEVDGAVPRALSELTARALSRARAARPASAAELATAVRRWQAASAIDREVEERLRRASEALERAGALRGTERLAEVDVASAALLEVTAKRPTDERGPKVAARIEELRRLALTEHQHDGVRKARRRAVTVGAALLGMIGVGWLGTLAKAAWDDRTERQAEAEREREATEALARTESLAPGPAVDAITRLLDGHAPEKVVPAARLRLGDRQLEAGRREQSLATWLECALLDAPSRPSVTAWGNIARTFLAEGDPTRAMDGLAAALRSTSDPTERSSLLALWAEALWCDGRPAEAASVLEEVEHAERASTGPVERTIALRRNLPLLTPREPWEHLTAWTGTVGHFRGKAAGQETVLGDYEARRFELRGIGREGVDGTARLTWPLEHKGRGTKACNLDGDEGGFDELIELTWKAPIPPGDARTTPALLRILDLRGAEERVRFEREVPYGGFVLEVGDVDGDKKPDIVLGSHFPGAGVTVLRNLGGLQFERMTELGPMGSRPMRSANIRGIAIADLTGDGRNEVVLACPEWHLFGLRAFSYDREHGEFVALPVRRTDGETGPLGLVDALAPFDVDGDGRQDVVFALGCMMYDRLEPHVDGFLPQGIYWARWSEETRALEVAPLRDDGAKIRLRPAADGDALPVNQGTSRIAIARMKDGRAFLVTQGETYYGGAHASDWLTAEDLGAARGSARLGKSPLKRRLGGGAILLSALDTDGDGDDEVVFLDGTGALRAYGLPTELPTAAPSQGRPPAPSEAPSAEATRLGVAEWLGKLGWYRQAEQQYRSFRKESGSEGAEALAFGSTVDALGRQWRWDEAIEELRARIVKGGLREAEHRLLLAQYLDRTQRWAEAAKAYAEVERLGASGDRAQRAVAERAAELAPWRQSKEEALPPVERWSVSEPGCFRIANGQVECAETDARDSAPPTLWLPVLHDGGSFQLPFELQIDHLGHGHGVEIGFLDPAPSCALPNAPGLRFLVESSSVGPNRVILGFEREPPPGMPIDGGFQQPRGLRSGVAYDGVLSWDARGRLLGVTLRVGEDGPIEVSLLGRVPAGILRARMRLGIRVVTDNWAAGGAFRVALDPLRRPRDANPFPVAPQRIGLEAAHRLWAAGRASDAQALVATLAAPPFGLPEEDRRVAAFYASLLAWNAHPTPEGADALLAPTEDGAGPLSARALLHGRDLLLDPASGRVLGEVLLRRALPRWRTDRADALISTITTGLDLIAATETAAAVRADAEARVPVYGDVLDRALRAAPAPWTSEDRRALRVALDFE